MSEAKVKNAAMFAGGVLLTMLVVNTLANRVKAVKDVKNKVEGGF